MKTEVLFDSYMAQEESTYCSYSCHSDGHTDYHSDAGNSDFHGDHHQDS